MFLCVEVFSKDRAMQLQAAIESFFLHCRDHSQIELCVLYKASNQFCRRQYEKLKEKFRDVSFIEEVDFKEQVLAVVGGFEYVLFLVDDNLFVRDFYLADIVKSLRGNDDAVGFSLRVGSNTTYCYAHDAGQQVPAFRQVDDGILKYDWTLAEHDFGYPLEVSSSIYRAADILEMLRKVEFSNPNTLEWAMAANSHLYQRAGNCLLCFESSVTFCAPVNVVQTVWDNRVGGNHNYSVDKLAQIFEEGGRIDVERYSGFVPNSCHQEVELHFMDSGQAAAETVTTYVEPNGGHYGQQDLKPKFSVIMANYNNARYIAQAIESVVNQTFEDWELIIVEDCSTDNSLAVIEQYLGDGRIKLIRHDVNLGYTAALKTGIASVRSEYFGVLDSDDCLAPRAVETMYIKHVELPDCGLIYSQFVFCGEGLTQRKIGFCREIPPGGTSLDANVVSHFKTFKIRDYLKTAGYDENILYAEDIDIVYKMEEVAHLKFVDDCLYLHREAPDSLSRSPNKINVGIMSRVKARVNALKRRCSVSVEQGNQSFDQLFRRAVAEARKKYEDVEQYFIILTKLCENGMLTDVNWPEGAGGWGLEDPVLWLAANVDVQFDKLFALIGRHKAAGPGPPASGPGCRGSKPLVTVKMVTYNAEKFIRQAIDSVLAQTYRNFELLIVDDGSTDATAQLIASYSDSRIRYVHTPHRNGASARNRAIAQAAGEYLLCVDSDDFIEATYIEKMVASAQRHPEVDYFYPGRLAPVDETGNPTGEQWSYPDFSDNSTLVAFLFEMGYGPIPNPGSLKRRSLFDKVGGYDDVDSVEDFVFLCRNALRIRFMRVDDHLTYFYRRLPSSSSHNFRVRNEIMARVLNEMVSIYPPEVLCPQIAGIDDAALKERQYCEYLMRTFYKHAEGGMVQYGEYFKRYGDYYKQKLLQMTEPNKAVGSVETL
ncbi:MAG: glycosyltransferase family 2 protein [Planctomycetes bacterium]|nr:glycosyltransferase family 2 protein [Planctomycetota bacterium]